MIPPTPRDSSQTDVGASGTTREPRLFVACQLGAAMARRLSGIAPPLPGVAWYPQERLHVTICFIGEVGRAQVPAAGRAVAAIDAAAVELAVARVGRARIPGGSAIICAELAPAEPMQRLHAQVREALADAGIAVRHRAFRPHLTLGDIRCDGPAVDDWLAANHELAGPRFAVDGCGLFATETGPDGGRHRLLVHRAFRGPAAVG